MFGCIGLGGRKKFPSCAGAAGVHSQEPSSGARQSTLLAWNGEAARAGAGPAPQDAIPYTGKARFEVPILTKVGVDPSAGMMIRQERLERGVQGFAKSLGILLGLDDVRLEELMEQ